jgi:hypothetical protein
MIFQELGDQLNLPIAQILGRAKRRPLTRAEFLRLMTLLTTQRIIANGLAQLRFEQVWPDPSRIERPTDSTLRGLASPKLMEVRELIGQLVLAQGRKGVVFSHCVDVRSAVLGDSRAPPGRRHQASRLRNPFPSSSLSSISKPS